MDEFDRPDCALENLEQVVSLTPNDRALTGDAIFRLIKLYKRAGEQERLTQLIRKYWELGKKRNDASVFFFNETASTHTCTLAPHPSLPLLGIYTQILELLFLNPDTILWEYIHKF